MEPQLPDNSRSKRFMFAALGVFFVVLAGFGAVLPGIPTVGPLLLGSFFLTKSSPRLEKKLIRNRFFAKYLPYLDGSSEMSFQARLASIAMMWASITLSLTILYFSGKLPTWFLVTMIVAGLIGTVFILRFGKNRKNAAVSSGTAKEHDALSADESQAEPIKRLGDDHF